MISYLNFQIRTIRFSLGLFLLTILFSPTICKAQNILNNPQKIVIDEKRNRFIVSNFGSGGILVTIDSLGIQDTLVQNAGMTDGMQIVGDTLYGSGPYPSGTVRGYDLETGLLVMDLDLSSAGVVHLSSFVVDSSGILYTSERFGNRIFKINPKTQEYWVFAEGGGIDEPNGLLYEPEYNRLIVCLEKPNPPILAVSLSDSTVSTITTTNLGGSDGIAKDMAGNYYITGYYLSGIYKFTSDFSGQPELFFEGDYIVYPTYHAEHNSLLVTRYNQNDWGEIPIENNVLNNPESVVYDSIYNRYLVSNCGDGNIIQINESGQQEYFSTVLTYTLGLHIVGDTLFVSSNAGEYSGVVGFLLSTGGLIFHVDIPEKQLLNDITSDLSGNLYVTDCDANKIFKVRIKDQTYTTFVNSGVGYPNGILYDSPNNRLLVLNCLLPYRPVTSVNLSDSTVSTVVNTRINSIDGLTVDNQGNFYFSSWVTDKVYRYDESFTNPPEVVSSGHTDPADIFYNKLDNTLAIPNYSSNSVDFITILPSNINDESNQVRSFKLKQNYPNPFNPKTTIKYSLPNQSKISIKIYNALGQHIRTLVNEIQQPGDKSVVWDGRDSNNSPVSSGVYIYTITSGTNSNKIQSRKMLLLK